MEQKQEDILVSIFCITYNHSKFIGKAIEGFLMQKCNFKTEIIIGDDCSTDGTTQIIDDYVAKYPGRIKRLIYPRNIGATQNVIRVALETKGKYVATCDGDDYWIDPYKLQKQVDFLEKHPDYVMCCHYTKEINYDETELIYMDFNPVPLEYSFSDLIVNKQTETCTATIVYRNVDEIRQLYQNDWFLKCHACDKFLKLYSTWATGKKIYVLPEVMSCYRRHPGGVWSPVAYVPLKKMQLSDFYIILKIFTYTLPQKLKLLYFYFKKYFVFEVKHNRASNAFQTIKTIVTLS
ncbi:glycosyltransferase family 2 protein [Pedobacter sandarakinus]|uniref:glycosyltransferase family 2 protein n=1 Tax=Pedobacter sandarakinus TaxID=353156 RepID=UPI0022466918|nr:glycosyltransferase [Pedobacter sandarakinus]MCX2574298.1 glycosyltransferase [Pedobacter sandarakinus]